MDDWTQNYSRAVTWVGAYVLASDDLCNQRGIVLRVAPDGGCAAWRTLFSERRLEVVGAIAAEALASCAVRGHIDFARLRAGEVTYHVAFQTDDGMALALRGLQRLSRRAVRHSLTTFSAEILAPDGASIATAELRLDPLHLGGTTK